MAKVGIGYIVPNMEVMFGKLTFGSLADEITERRNGKRVQVSRVYNIFSDVQRADNIQVIVPANANKGFEFEDEIKLENVKIVANGGNINGNAYTDFVMYADNIVKA